MTIRFGGPKNPSSAETFASPIEDLEIMTDHDFQVLKVSMSNARKTLAVAGDG